MQASHSVEHSFPLSASLSPDIVIEHLQTYEPLLASQASVLRYSRRTVDLNIADNPFFTEDGSELESYDVTKRVDIIAVIGLNKDITFPATFQSFNTGVRVHATAPAGVTVWSTYEVQPRNQSSPDAGGWQLVERAKAEFSVLLKPFVVETFKAAHKEQCQKIVEGLERLSTGRVASLVTGVDGSTQPEDA